MPFFFPFQGKKAPDEGFLTPVNADYELAEIIMKAVNPDPEERWTDPKELGKALASYMQRNSVNDIPITPHTPLDVKPEDIVVLTETNQDPHEEEFEDNYDKIRYIGVATAIALGVGVAVLGVGAISAIGYGIVKLCEYLI